MPLELVIGAVVGAAATSTTIRKTVRRGLVYGLAGTLLAYDKVTGLAKMARGQSKESTVEPGAPAGAEGHAAETPGAPAAPGNGAPEAAH